MEAARVRGSQPVKRVCDRGAVIAAHDLDRIAIELRLRLRRKPVLQQHEGLPRLDQGAKRKRQAGLSSDPGSAPVATGRAGSALQADQDPTYSGASMPMALRPAIRCEAALPLPQ